ncbi:Tethering factor for nuclear proteasome STS1 [Holothuria leucospilota]|uniref:Tethering factor for nuclear proteasome STS1 n=1 Tax=Holothuria leucospilota TaxID=206669 RepID=A0A9Q1H6E0_HOLLE|nr:Tethering factor for nuclear proteasome STS1 [Holothuria leucospilota]
MSSPERTSPSDFDVDSLICSPFVYHYGTTANPTRRRLELSAFQNTTPVASSTPLASSTPVASSTPISKPQPQRKRRLRSASLSPVKRKDHEESTISVEEVLLWIQASKKQRTGQEPIRGKLYRRLNSLTAHQLSALVEQIIEKHPHLEEEVSELLPQPDITPHLAHLSDLLHNIYRSLPRQRLCSSRSPFCYRRVKSHIFAFKKFCIQQGRHYLACEMWETAIEYSLSAWQHTNYLPKWDCPVHNKLKAGCMRGLAAICVDALGSGNFPESFLDQLKPRLQEIRETSPEFEACLRKLDLITQTAAPSR